MEASTATSNGGGTGPSADLPLLQKAPTGIVGLDEVTGGGFPRGRSTLICGPAGCGKTLLAMEFLVRGAFGQGYHYGYPVPGPEVTLEWARPIRV